MEHGGVKIDNPSVIIGLLSHRGDFCADMLQCLDKLVKKSIDAGISVRISKTFGTLIANMRNDTAQICIDNDADYLLFIDSDMVFNDDFLIRLLKHNRDIVSGLAVARKAPFNPVAKKADKDGTYHVIDKLDEGRFYSDVDMVGCAFILIKTDVFKKLKKPWFAMPPYKDGCMGEDVYFCRLAKEAGYDICVDTSIIVGHIGEKAYTIFDHLEYKERQKQAKQDAA